MLTLLLTLLAGCCGGWGDVIDVRRIFKRQVGQVCCRWNHDLRFKRWLKSSWIKFKLMVTHLKHRV